MASEASQWFLPKNEVFWKEPLRATEPGILRPEVDCGFAESNEGGALQKKRLPKIN